MSTVCNQEVTTGKLKEMGQQADTLRALSEIYDDEDVTNALNDMLDIIAGRNKPYS